MECLNLNDNLNKSEVINKVKRFIYKYQNNLPIEIITNNKIDVILVLEDCDFRFKINNDSIIITD